MSDMCMEFETFPAPWTACRVSQCCKFSWWHMIACFTPKAWHHAAVWYSVDLPSGQDLPRLPQPEGVSGKPQLYLLNVSVWVSMLLGMPPGKVAESFARSLTVQFQSRSGSIEANVAQDVSGVFRPGVLCALVGSSGAGKTTLLDCLAGRKTTGRIQGDIRVQVDADSGQNSGYPLCGNSTLDTQVS